MATNINLNLKSTSNYGWSAGFLNMLAKEGRRWLNLKSLVIQIVIWTVLINVIVAFYLFVIPGMIQSIREQPGNANSADLQNIDLSPHGVADIGLSTYFEMLGLTLFIGAIIFGHDSLLKERETGTAAWLLSKPVSRKTIILSKILAQSFGVLAIIMLLQGLMTYAMCSIELGGPVPVLPFLAGMGIMALNILFFLILAIGLGAFSTSKGVTIGVPLILGLIATPVFLALNQIGTIKLLGQSIDFTLLGDLAPWKLTDFASSIATKGYIANDNYWYLPIIVTAVMILAFVAATMVKFDRLEL